LLFKVFAGNDITSLFIVLPLVFYFNHKNKAFWTGMGQVTCAVASLLPLLAYLAIPAVGEAAEGTAGDMTEADDVLCIPDTATADDEEGTPEAARSARQVAALALFFLCKLLMGVAGVTYWTLGTAYMVDAVQPSMAPAAIGLCYMAGSPGYMLHNMIHATLQVSLASSLAACWPLAACASACGGSAGPSCPPARPPSPSCWSVYRRTLHQGSRARRIGSVSS
jgi:hypothetical protein